MGQDRSRAEITAAPKVLVTGGGAGFLGSHLCDALLARGGCEVVALDNLMSGHRENLTGGAMAQPGFRFVEQDVCEPFFGQFDRIYHLACPASPSAYQADPIATARICFLGTLNTLDLARATGARVLLASTSEVYGDPLVHPQSEDYLGNVNTTGPRACYDEGKRVAETLAFDYARHHGGVEVRVARIFNTYGPRMHRDDGRVVSNFVTQALEGRDITLFGGDGSQSRSFCFYSDLVDGLLRLMALDAVCGPVNLGNPEELSIAELARLIGVLTGGAESRVENQACHRTTRPGAARTSAGRRLCLVGRLRSRCRRALPARLPISVRRFPPTPFEPGIPHFPPAAAAGHPSQVVYPMRMVRPE